MEVSQARVLQRLYLTLMFRGRRARQNRKGLSSPLRSFLLSALIFILFGCITLGLDHVGYIGFVGSLHAITFLMIGMNLASTCSSLLFSADEADVLLHRPIHPRALLSAKVRVIVMVSLILALALNLCGFAVGVFRPGGSWLFLPAHLLSLTLEVIFCASFVVLAYNLCLRWFGRERLENLMTTVQVGVAIAAMIGGQFMSRMIGGLDQIKMTTEPSWLAILPPAWFGALDILLSGHGSSPGILTLAAIGVVATIGTAWLGITRLAATYEHGLVMLNEGNPSAVKPGTRRGNFTARLLDLPLIRAWVRDPVERSAFRLAAAELGRSRGVKLRVYPMLAQFLIFPLFMFLGGSDRASSLRDTITIAFAGSFIAMIPVVVIDRLRPSEDWRAADLFRHAPLSRPSALFHGTRKAVILILCMPPMLVVLTLCIIWQRGGADTIALLLPGFIAMHVFSLIPALGRMYLPFSLEPELESHNTQGCLFAAFFMFGAIILAGLTALAWKTGFFAWFLAAEICLAVILYTFLIRLIDRRQLTPE